MSQEPADLLGCHVFFDVKVDQTVAGVTQTGIIGIAIEGEERRSAQLVQQRNDLLVFHAHPTHVTADLPKRDTPTPQESMLTLRERFHLECSRWQGFLGILCRMIVKRPLGKFYRFGNCLSANGARHSAVIASQGIPFATCFSTCDTMIRVPRKVGLP